MQDVLTTQKWKAFCAIPALLHVNFTALPGPGDGQEPHGFARPQYAVDSLHHAGEFFPEFRGGISPPRRACFLGLYAMGSVGSSCFTTASDIDFWLIHASDAFPPGDLPWLKHKLEAVEAWAMEKTGLEVHFYIHDLSEIQKGTFSYDTENAGEFGPILKEEFLRTAVYVAGMEPQHWYESAANAESARIDFGPIPHLTPDQYLAACVMQLEKALEKPFKSALKIALLRRLAARPLDKWPAEIFLERIASGANPDPYMILLEYIWEYFSDIGAVEDHTFLKGVLYLKTIAEENSPERVRRSKDRLLAARFQAIGRPIDFAGFDNFFHWPFAERIRFSDQIARFLQASLKEITQYSGRRHLDPTRLRALTQRINLRRGTGLSIETLTFADVPSKGEPVITLVCDSNRHASESWMLTLQKFSGRPDYDRLVSVKSGPDPVSLLAFAVKNNLIRRDRTEIRFHPTDRSPRKIQEILDSLTRIFSGNVLSSALEAPEQPLRHLLVLCQNVINRPETRGVTVFTRSSWGATAFQYYQGAESLHAALEVLLVQSAPLDGVEVVVDSIIGPDPFESAMAIMTGFSTSPGAAGVFRDGMHFILIRNRAAFPSSTATELLVEMGRRGGAYQFQRLPDDEIGALLGEIMARAKGNAATLYRFRFEETVGFLLIDDQGRCDGWTIGAEDADYSMRSVLRYINGLAKERPVELFVLDYRKEMREPWAFVRLPIADAKGPSSTDLHIELIDGGLVAVRFGPHVIERSALQDACAVVAQLIKATRKVNRYYPPFLTGITFPIAVQASIAIPDASRRKRELEQRIGQMLAAMYN